MKRLRRNNPTPPGWGRQNALGAQRRERKHDRLVPPLGPDEPGNDLELLRAREDAWRFAGWLACFVAAWLCLRLALFLVTDHHEIESGADGFSPSSHTGPAVD